MAWTTPSARTTGELITASIWNTDLKDNLLILKTPLNDDGSVKFTAGVVEGRLTLTSATPITTADVTAATTVRYEPFTGTGIALHNGTNWQVYSLETALTIAVPATTDTLYDVFCFQNAGTPTLELTAWTNDTTRATALTTLNGILVKTGATTRRYLGSFRTTGVSGQTEDSVAKRYVWNYYNRAHRRLLVTESANTWASSGTSLRQVNGASGNQVDLVVGVAGAQLALTAHLAAFGAAAYATAIGEDSTSAKASECINALAQAVADASAVAGLTATLTKYPAVGRHYYAWLEVASAASTFIGDNNAPTLYQSGLSGWIDG